MRTQLDGSIKSTRKTATGATTVTLLIANEQPRVVAVDRGLEAKLHSAISKGGMCRFTIDGRTLLDLEVIG